MGERPMGGLLLPPLVRPSEKRISGHVLDWAGHRENAAVIIAEELGFGGVQCCLRT